MVKNQLVEVNIDSLGMNGEGVSRYEGMTIFTRGALIGEKVLAKIIFVKPTFCNAIIERILVVSPYRVEPICPIFGKCGGCQLMHLSYSEQLEYKRSYIEGLTRKMLGKPIAVGSCVGSEPNLRYRNKLSLPVRRGASGEIVFGFFANNSHRIVPLEDCFLQPEWIKSVIEIVREFMERNGLKPYDESYMTGDIRHVVVRDEGGLLCICVVINRDNLVEIKMLNDMLKDRFGNVSLYLNINKQNTNVILGKKFVNVSKKAEKITVDGITLELHPNSFFQVNDDIRIKLYARAQEILVGSGADVALDAYSGAGLMSAILSKFMDVIAVEIVKEATMIAEQILIDNKITNVKVVNGDCAEVVPTLIKKIVERGQKATILLDPPKAGVSDSVATSVNESGVSDIVYISCNESTMLRDIKKMTNYEIAEITPYDMFCQCSRVEVLAHLKKI